MNGDTQMPTIEFGEGTTYDDLYTLLWWVKGRLQAGSIVFRFVLADGTQHEGIYSDGDVATMTVALYVEATPTGETVTFSTDELVKVVYL